MLRSLRAPCVGCAGQSPFLLCSIILGILVFFPKLFPLRRRLFSFLLGDDPSFVRRWIPRWPSPHLRDPPLPPSRRSPSQAVRGSPLRSMELPMLTEDHLIHSDSFFGDASVSLNPPRRSCPFFHLRVWPLSRAVPFPVNDRMLPVPHRFPRVLILVFRSNLSETCMHHPPQLDSPLGSTHETFLSSQFLLPAPNSTFFRLFPPQTRRRVVFSASGPFVLCDFFLHSVGFLQAGNFREPSEPMAFFVALFVTFLHGMSQDTTPKGRFCFYVSPPAPALPFPSAPLARRFFNEKSQTSP